MEMLNNYNLRVEELFTLLCIYNDKKDLLLNYLRTKNNEQKVVFMQPMLRKQFLTVGAEYEELMKSFDLSAYSLSEHCIMMCSQIRLEMGSIEENLVAIVSTEPLGEFDQFVQEFLNKFPAGIKNNGGKILRSNSIDVKSKLVGFMNKYKKYASIDLILKATDTFIKRYKGDYSYCPTAEYFVSKNKTSALASECEGVLNVGNVEDIKSPFEREM